MFQPNLALLLCAALCVTVGSSALAEPQFERIGMPCVIKQLGVWFVAPDGKGGHMAWGDFESPDQRAIIGANIETGETTWVDVGMFRFTHIAMTLGADGRIYVYTGNPSHFLAYDMATGELEDLGAPAEPANYFSKGQMGPDGKTYWIGSYPGTHLVSVNTETGETKHHAKIAEDPLENYIWPQLAVADDGIVYCPVGLHHKELWSYDPASGEKHQILPEEFLGEQGCPSVWLADDGAVYGRAGSTAFLPPRPRGGAGGGAAGLEQARSLERRGWRRRAFHRSRRPPRADRCGNGGDTLRADRLRGAAAADLLRGR